MTNMIAIQTNTILLAGIILVVGYLFGKIANLLKLPKITGYITAGILLEPSFSGILPKSIIEHSGIISNFALCIITYAIGGSLCFKNIRKLGKNIMWMTVLEAEFAFLLVSGGLFLMFTFLGKFGNVAIQPIYFVPLSLLLGALASPTDPTAALAIKEEYKAKGPVTTTILGIAAFDDATGIINFSIATAVAVLVLGGAGGNLAQAISFPLITILLSIVIGIAFALLLLVVAKKVEDKGVMVVLILGALFLCFGVSQLLNLDELLSTMVLGCAVVNWAKDTEKFFISIRDYFEELVFVIFFVLAGANLNFSVLKSSIAIVSVFVLLRTIGKVSGVYLGGVISGAESKIKKYTAFGLIPQGGIVVGLALLIGQNPKFSEISGILLNIILGTTVFHEFIGPLLAEIGLKKAKEIKRVGIPSRQKILFNSAPNFESDLKFGAIARRVA